MPFDVESYARHAWTVYISHSSLRLRRKKKQWKKLDGREREQGHMREMKKKGKKATTEFQVWGFLEM